MTDLHIYDNGGETFDRYTVVIPGEEMMLGLSENPSHPQGFSQWTSGEEGPHLGKRIPFSTLPENVQRHIIERTGQ